MKHKRSFEAYVALGVVIAAVVALVAVAGLVAYQVWRSYEDRTIYEWQGNVTGVGYLLNSKETNLFIGGRSLVFEGIYTGFVVGKCYVITWSAWMAEKSGVYTLESVRECA